MTNQETHKRLCGFIPIPLYLLFKNVSGHFFHFKKGYTQLGLESAIRMWIWMITFHTEKKEDLEKIAKSEYSHIKDPIKQHEAMMQEALDEYIENHKQD
jgi:hypothetical protein